MSAEDSTHFFRLADIAQLAEQLICNQQVTGSIPAIGFIWTFSSVGESNRLITGRSWVRVPEGPLACRSGGIGRRAGLKIPWWRHRAGSTPACGIDFRSPFWDSFLFTVILDFPLIK